MKVTQVAAYGALQTFVMVFYADSMKNVSQDAVVLLSLSHMIGACPYLETIALERTIQG